MSPSKREPARKTKPSKTRREESRRDSSRRVHTAGPPPVSVAVPGGMRRLFGWLLVAVILGGLGFTLWRAGHFGAAGAAIAVEPGSVPTPVLTAVLTAVPAAVPAAALAATPVPEPAAAATANPSDSNLRRVGIVSGHRGNDTGTLCKDGLTEASVNFDHASRVADIMRGEGFTVDILDEKDVRLNGYKAEVFLSIHADSCEKINDLATGYKVARSQDSALPKIEDALVSCISARYKQATGLRFNRNTITHNMTEYHGFYKIDPLTPGAIIETGFMYLDRPVLTKQADRVARGIADGLLCFLRGETP